MTTRKTAIAVPEALLDEVDEAAVARGESRSRFICRVLREAIRARRDAEVTRRLNELFAEPAAGAEQRRSGASLDDAGTDWGTERW